MLRNVPNHYTTSVRPSVRTQSAAKQVFVKSNIWEFHEKLLAYCAGFGHNDTGSRTTSRDKRTLCISSASGCVMIGAKSGAEVVHTNVWFCPTHFSRKSYDLSTQSDNNQLSLRYAVQSQPADMPTAPTGSGKCSFRLAKGHTGSTVPHNGVYWVHRS